MWVENWLTNRETRVRIKGTLSEPRYLTKGVPQGSVISPLLFAIFINDLVDGLEDDVSASLFADDAAAWTKNDNVQEALATIQRTSDKIVSWSKKWKLHININKCELIIFSTDPKDRKGHRKITMDDNDVIQVDSAKFLGITYEANHTFTKHTDEVIKKAKKAVNLIQSLKGTDWGWRIEDTRTIYISCIRPILEYGQTAWMPWLCTTRMNKLESCQAQMAKIAASLTKTCPNEIALLETKLPTLQLRACTAACIAYEKSARLSDNNLRNRIISEHQEMRLKRTSTWREKAKTWIDERLSEEDREKFAINTLEPWRRTMATTDEVTCEVRKKDLTQEDITKVKMKLDELEEMDVEIYCDGSAEGGTENGGAGVIITRGNWRKPVIIDTVKEKCGKFCSSYDAEVVAFRVATGWLANHKEDWRTARIWTDSKSLVDAVNNYGPREDLKIPALQQAMKQITSINEKHIKITWIPSHIGIPGNEMADEAANEATTMEGRSTSSYAAAVSMIKRNWKKTNISHERARRTYTQEINWNEEKKMNKIERNILMRFRSGHLPKLKHMQKRYGLIEEGNCEDCEEEEEETSEHLLKCPAHQPIRLRIFGQYDIPICLTVTQPRQIINYLQYIRPLWFQ